MSWKNIKSESHRALLIHKQHGTPALRLKQENCLSNGLTEKCQGKIKISELKILIDSENWIKKLGRKMVQNQRPTTKYLCEK
jgi:hypothetical protein